MYFENWFWFCGVPLALSGGDRAGDTESGFSACLDVYVHAVRWLICVEEIDDFLGHNKASMCEFSDLSHTNLRTVLYILAR
jgi:hypothetical protein